jgi:small-conductance mechanosensitive channel
MTTTPWAQGLKAQSAGRGIMHPMAKAPFAAVLCLALAAPSAATVRAVVPARLPLAPGARAVLPTTSVATLASPSSRLVAAPQLVLPPALLAAPGVVAPALRVPADAPAASAASAASAAPAPFASRAAATPAAPAAAFASTRELAAPLASAADAPRAAPEAGRAAWEPVWSGAGPRKAPSSDAVVAAAASASATGLSKPARRSRLAGVAAALPLPVAAASAGTGILSAAMPFLQAGGLIAGAYVGSRLSRWVIGKLAGRFGWSAPTVALARFVVAAGFWGAAAGYGLALIGVTDSALLTTFGGSGAAMALAVKDVVGNLVHGVHFLITRPYTVGSRVVIDEVPGTVHELTLRYVIVRTEQDPPYAFYTYSELTAKSVTVVGTYETKAARLKLRRPALPQGLLKALRDAASPKLWKPAILSALGITALSLLPLARGWFSAKGITTWFDAAFPWAAAALILFLGRSVAQGVHGAIARLAQRYGWSAPATTLIKLAATMTVWGVAGSFALNTLGVSWAALATSLSISTVILGIAVNDFVTGVFQAFLILLLRPFQIGDRIAVGKVEGEVLDINFQHVVLKKDDSSYILLPYASVKGFRSAREYGHKAP